MTRNSRRIRRDRAGTRPTRRLRTSPTWTKTGISSRTKIAKTKTEGLFVAGELRTKPVRQVATAVADGAIAATNASIYLESL